MEGVAAAFVAAVRAAGVRRMGWNWNWDGDVVVGLGRMEGRWTIVRSVRRVREESKGGILSFWCCYCWGVLGESRIKSRSGSALNLHVICNCGSGVFALPEELIGVMGRAAPYQVKSSFTSPSGNSIFHHFCRLFIYDLEVISSLFILPFTPSKQVRILNSTTTAIMVCT